MLFLLLSLRFLLLLLLLLLLPLLQRFLALVYRKEEIYRCR